MLQSGRTEGLDAAFFLSTRAEAKIALSVAANSKHYELLNLWTETGSEPLVPGLSSVEISAGAFWSARGPLRTLESRGVGIG